MGDDPIDGKCPGYLWAYKPNTEPWQSRCYIAIQTQENDQVGDVREKVKCRVPEMFSFKMILKQFLQFILEKKSTFLLYYDWLNFTCIQSPEPFFKRARRKCENYTKAQGLIYNYNTKYKNQTLTNDCLIKHWSQIWPYAWWICPIPPPFSTKLLIICCSDHISPHMPFVLFLCSPILSHPNRTIIDVMTDHYLWCR